MTTTSLQNTIASVNSTHLRTHPDVAREAAPENATGANTAATMIIALRITNSAHTKNDAIRYPSPRIRVSAGVLAPAIAPTGAIRRPSVARLPNPVVATMPSDRASVTVNSALTTPIDAAAPSTPAPTPTAARPNAPGARVRTALISSRVKIATITTPASVAVIPSVEWNQPPDRFTVVVFAMTVHIQPVTFVAASPNDVATSLNADPASWPPTDPATFPTSHNGFNGLHIPTARSQIEPPTFWKNATIVSAPPISTAAPAATSTPVRPREA